VELGQILRQAYLSLQRHREGLELTVGGIRIRKGSELALREAGDPNPLVVLLDCFRRPKQPQTADRAGGWIGPDHRNGGYLAALNFGEILRKEFPEGAHECEFLICTLRA
jgi:hypothetical protein